MANVQMPTDIPQSLEGLEQRLHANMTQLHGFLLKSKNPSPQLKELGEMLQGLPERFAAEKEFRDSQLKLAAIWKNHSQTRIKLLAAKASSLELLAKEAESKLAEARKSLPNPKPVTFPKVASPPPAPAKKFKLLSAEELRQQIIKKAETPPPLPHTSGNIWEGWQIPQDKSDDELDELEF